MRLELCAAPDAATWERVAAGSPAATPFHTPVWASVAQARGFAPAPLGMRTADGTLVVYPLSRWRRRLAPGLADAWSSWPGAYGGPIAERPLTAEEQSAAHRTMLRATRGNVELTVGPGGAEPPADLPGERIEDSTHAIAIDEDFDGLLRRMRSGHRAAYRRGLREGIRVRPASGPDAVARYLELYEASMRRWGERTTVRHPPSVIERLDDLATERPDVVGLLAAEHGGRLMAASWVLRWRGHWVVWQTVSHDPPKGLSYTAVLYGELLRQAVEEEARLVDLNPSAGQRGVSDSKRWYGARELPIWRLRVRRPLADRVRPLVDLAGRVRRAGAGTS